MTTVNINVDATTYNNNVGIYKQGEGESRTQGRSRRKHLHPPRSDRHLIKRSDEEKGEKEEEKDNMEDSQVWNH